MREFMGWVSRREIMMRMAILIIVSPTSERMCYIATTGMAHLPTWQIAPELQMAIRTTLFSLPAGVLLFLITITTRGLIYSSPTDVYPQRTLSPQARRT